MLSPSLMQMHVHCHHWNKNATENINSATITCTDNHMDIPIVNLRHQLFNNKPTCSNGIICLTKLSELHSTIGKSLSPKVTFILITEVQRMGFDVIQRPNHMFMTCGGVGKGAKSCIYLGLKQHGMETVDQVAVHFRFLDIPAQHCTLCLA